MFSFSGLALQVEQFSALDLHTKARSHDTGSKQRMDLLPGVKASALFAGTQSEHRIVLERRFEGAGEHAPYALWIGMNPSAAATDRDDLTVRKEQTWTLRMGLYRYVKLNFGSYRATQPGDLSKPNIEVVLEEINTLLMVQGALRAQRVILACGIPPEPLMPAATRQLQAVLNLGVAVECLGVANSGWPLHSSRLGYDAPPGRTERFMPFAQMPPVRIPRRGKHSLGQPCQDLTIDG